MRAVIWYFLFLAAVGMLLSDIFCSWQRSACRWKPCDVNILRATLKIGYVRKCGGNGLGANGSKGFGGKVLEFCGGIGTQMKMIGYEKVWFFGIGTQMIMIAYEKVWFFGIGTQIKMIAYEKVWFFWIGTQMKMIGYEKVWFFGIGTQMKMIAYEKVWFFGLERR